MDVCASSRPGGRPEVVASIDKDKLMVLTKSTETELGKSLKWRL